MAFMQEPIIRLLGWLWAGICLLYMVLCIVLQADNASPLIIAWGVFLTAVMVGTSPRMNKFWS